MHNANVESRLVESGVQTFLQKQAVAVGRGSGSKFQVSSFKFKVSSCPVERGSR